MDFFEALRERARKHCNENLLGLNTDMDSGIFATIEALKEIMVGESMRGKIDHEDDVTGYKWTNFYASERFVEFTVDGGWVGTDGEEVVVMVFRA